MNQNDLLKDPLRALTHVRRSFQLAKFSLWSSKKHLGAPPAGPSEVTSRVPDADVTPATDVFQDSIHTAYCSKTEDWVALETGFLHSETSHQMSKQQIMDRL